jgi:hypothetical protein
MPPLPPLHLDPTEAPNLGNATAAAFEGVNRSVLAALSLVCEAEAVTVPDDCNPTDPSALRREVFFSLQRLGFLETGEPQSEREMMEVLRETMPIEAEALATIFCLRAMCQTHPATAYEEAQEALKWATRAVLSPL